MTFVLLFLKMSMTDQKKEFIMKQYYKQ